MLHTWRLRLKAADRDLCFKRTLATEATEEHCGGAATITFAVSPDRPALNRHNKSVPALPIGPADLKAGQLCGLQAQAVCDPAAESVPVSNQFQRQMQHCSL